ncbi:MAG: glycosyltransferase family 1 protein, partial [Chthoniobacterales bacterium]
MSSTASPPNAPKRVGFISTRFAGTDGVTLEAAKWSQVFESWGARCFWMAGELDKPLAVSHREPLAFFNHPEILDLQGQLFGQLHRPHWVSDRVHEVKETLKTSIYDFLTRFEIDLLIPQNALAIPMHVPLGLAITEVIAETGIPTIAHHHDFVWERERFAVTSAADYLAVAFPPMLPGVQHVVINSMQQAELTRRYQQASTVIPNVLDFDAAPPAIDDFSSDFRAQIGVARDDILVLQPTRLVARKGIEHTIELLRRMNMPELKLVLSHPPGDEGLGYWTFLQAQIAEAGVACIPIWERIAAARSLDPQGRKIFTLSDAYLHA